MSVLNRAEEAVMLSTGDYTINNTGDIAGAHKVFVADADGAVFDKASRSSRRRPGGRTDIDIVATFDAGSRPIADDRAKRAVYVVRECFVTNGVLFPGRVWIVFCVSIGFEQTKNPTGQKSFVCFGTFRPDTQFRFRVSILFEYFSGMKPIVPARNRQELLRGPETCSGSGIARRFAVCVGNSCSGAAGAMARSGLGKGLGALIGTPAIATPRDGSDRGERVHQIELASIVPSTLQPRKDFARDVLLELIESIRQHGIIQPLIVRQVGTRFELIAGERRWRAAQELGLATVPAIVRTANDLEVLELSLIENLQRADLNPIEEAQGYARLANEFGMRQEDIALKVGRSRAAVANALRLLDLHPQVQIWLAQNLVSVGHAKV